MKYSESLKNSFPEIDLKVEDLYFLENFQVSYLPDRVPQLEFAVLLHSYPKVKKFLISKYPPIKGFIQSILKKYIPINNQILIDEYCQEILWEIADLIIYNKYPDIYDANINLRWELNEILPAKSLEGKTVIDAGAGSGRIAFLVVPFSKTVFAVEPVSGFRKFIREKAKKEELNNLFAIDGFLNSIPLPDNSVDVLITSNAIGWNLEEELLEIERVLKPSGEAIHLLRNPDSKTENPFHDIFLSKKWNYTFIDFGAKKGLKIKYSKIIN